MGKGHSLQPPSPSDPRGTQGQSGAGTKPCGMLSQVGRVRCLLSAAAATIGFKCGAAAGGDQG